MISGNLGKGRRGIIRMEKFLIQVLLRKEIKGRNHSNMSHKPERNPPIIPKMNLEPSN